jgi:hypothetical protein
MRRYSEAIKADVRRRMSPPNRQSVTRISEETGIHVVTVYVWPKGWRLAGTGADALCAGKKLSKCQPQTNLAVGVPQQNRLGDRESVSQGATTSIPARRRRR